MLCFACDPSLQADNVRLFWNLPSQKSKAVTHDCYEELSWKKNDKLSAGYEFISVPREMNTSGAFHFFYTVDGR